MKRYEEATILNQINSERGFSLIEISILLIVVGLIFVPILRIVQHDNERESFTRTIGTLGEAKDSINKFYANTSGAYPCPAGLLLDQDNALSGVSANCSNINNFPDCSNPLWETNANGGVCRTSNIIADAVIIGAVPYADVNTHPEIALDMWGNKIIYAVPFLNTDVDPANNVQGVRMVTLDASRTVVPTATGAEIFLFSTGSSAVGAFTKDGVKVSACGIASDGYESENCDFDDVFFVNDTAGVFSRVTGTEFYDDITDAQTSYPISTWFEHEDNPIAGGANNRFAITKYSKIGIGTEAPLEALHVAGDIRVETRDSSVGSGSTLPCYSGTECFEDGGKLKTPNVCDDATNCFQPQFITKNMPQMKCDASNLLHGSQVVMGINASPTHAGTGVRVHCSSPKDKAGNSILDKSLTLDTGVLKPSKCLITGEVVTGIDSSGDFICAIPN